MKHDITKLPKWAQQRIQNLERDCDSLRDALLVSESQEQTRVGLGISVEPGRIGEPERWLPNTSVCFYLDDERRELDSWVSARISGDAVSILASHGGIYVEPRASNSISIKLRRDW